MAILVAASVGGAPSVLAQKDFSAEAEIPDVIDRAAVQSSGDIFENRSLLEDAAFTFGFGYDEAKLAKDVRRIDVIYRDLQRQQDSDGPIIRTRDLANPFNSSLRSQ